MAILSAFYDGGRTAAQAGDFVYNTVIPALQAQCPGKSIYVTESAASAFFFKQL